MAIVGREGSTAEEFKLTTGEKLLLLALIAWAMLGLFVLLVGVGMIR
jgi:hypothetical protein